MAEQRLVVTLLNGRSHPLELPADVDPHDGLVVLRGGRPASEVGWADGDGAWLATKDGGGWVRRDAVVEAVVVDWPETRNDIY
jgi:hypothetical protein